MKTIKNVQLITWMLVALHVSGFNMNPNRVELSHELEAVRTNEMVEILVRNSKGKIVYRTEIEDGQDISDYFDITHLPEGDYLMEKVYDLEIEVIPFSVTQPEFNLKVDVPASMVTTGTVEFGDSYRIFKPVIMSRGDLVYISKPVLTEQNLQIRIYNKFNELIYSEKIKKNGQIYDLSQVIDEDMRFDVWANGRKYSETFKF